ncbi:MAG: LPS export ABC transporter permease LptF [Alphaproteobacteria bacterium]|nr:LPS export ABC transporter permease LptF [Alphaproteobacteria bacterium]
MIRRINLYLFRQVLTAFLFSGIAVTFVVLFTQSFRMLSFVIDNSGSTLVFFQLMGLMIPTFLPLIIPLSVGIGVLFIYQKFAVDSELVIMRSAGISPMHIATPALALAGLMIAIGLVLTLWVTPAANRTLVSLQYKVRDEYSALMIRPGAFNDLAEGLTFFARRRASHGGMEDILVHDVRNPGRPVTIMAKTGLFSVENNVPQVVVFQGRRQEVDVATGRLQQLNFDRYVLDLHLLKDNDQKRHPDPRELSFSQLLKTQTKGQSSHAQGKARAELHQRLASPLLSLTFAIIGVTLILIGDFNRRGMARRVVAAAILIVVVQAAMLGLVSQISQNGWIIPFLYFVILAPLPLCVRLLRMKTFMSWPRILPSSCVWRGL